MNRANEMYIEMKINKVFNELYPNNIVDVNSIELLEKVRLILDKLYPAEEVKDNE